jgi:transposase
MFGVVAEGVGLRRLYHPLNRRLVLGPIKVIFIDCWLCFKLLSFGNFSMSDDCFWLTEAQFSRLQPLLPNKPKGVPRVDDRWMISDIVHVIRNGLMFRGAPAAYGPHKTLYNRIKRWSQISVFDRIFAALAAEGTATETVMIDATHFKAHRTAPHRGELAQKGAVPRRIGRTKDGLNSKLHAVCDGDGKPLILLLTEGQISDYRGAVAVLAALPPDATTMIVVRRIR